MDVKTIIVYSAFQRDKIKICNDKKTIKEVNKKCQGADGLFV